MSQDQIISRYNGNPIIKANDLPYPCNSVFNAGAVKTSRDYLLLLRVEDKTGASHLTVARSDDGIDDWVIKRGPSLQPDPAGFPEECWGLEDPRITFLEPLKTWVIIYTGYSSSGPLVCIATTKDFRTFIRLGAVLPPENKDAALFPEKFKGLYAMLHRPGASDSEGKPGIWICFSPDLKHWGSHELVMPCGTGSSWDSGKIGLSTPPILTDKGWLFLYHGVKTYAHTSIYRVGAALLEKDNPGKLITQTREWIFGPQKEYERIGDVSNVVFPCGWIPEGDELKIYYGAADSSICLAHAKISDILALL